MEATKTTLVQVSIPHREHRILKTMALEKDTSISEFIRAAVKKIVSTKHGQSVAERIDGRNG